MYLGPLCYGYASNCHLVYLAIPETRPLCIKKQNLFVLFICNRKVKFKSVQINMKYVLYLTGPSSLNGVNCLSVLMHSISKETSM